MRRTIVNSLLGVIVAGLLSLNWLLRADPNQRNFEVLPDMAHSVPYDAFSANPNFADGVTLRAPVPGTVIRGFMPLHYDATPEDAQRAGRELANPFTPNDANAFARGGDVYATYCEICHGPGGKGDGVSRGHGADRHPLHPVVASCLLSFRAGRLPARDR